MADQMERVPAKKDSHAHLLTWFKESISVSDVDNHLKPSNAMALPFQDDSAGKRKQTTLDAVSGFEILTKHVSLPAVHPLN